MIFKSDIFRVLIIILIFFSSCIDQIDFEVPRGTADRVFVEGRVIKGETSFVEIAVSRIFDFSQDSRIPLKLEEMFLSDSDGNEMELITRVPGYYKIILDETTTVQAKIGTGYKIKMELLDGRVLESEIELLNATPDPIQLKLDKVQEVIRNEKNTIEMVDRIALSIDTYLDRNIPGGGIFWEVFNIFKVTDTPTEEGIESKTCYLTQLANVNDIYVLDPSETVNDEVRDFPLGRSVIDSRFAEGLYYEVRQYALGRGAFSYWNAINILSEREGNMFDSPVGEVPSNLKNINDVEKSIYGYFYASEEKVARIQVPMELVGNPDLRCPSLPEPLFPMTDEPCGLGFCCDCLSDPSATIEQPSFWID